MNRAKDLIQTYLLKWYPAGPSVVAFRTIGLFIVIFAVLTSLSSVSYQGQPENNPSAALTEYMSRRGIIVDTGSIHWLGSPEGRFFKDMGHTGAVFLARSGEDLPRDFYVAKVRLTPSAKVAGAAFWNITNTPSCSEHGLWARGKIVAVACMGPEAFITMSFLDFEGEDPRLTQSLPVVEQVKNAITNYQKTGHNAGLSSAFLEFSKPQRHVDVTISAESIFVLFDEGSAVVNITAHGFEADGESSEFFDFQTQGKAISGHVAWIVDTARATELIGKEKIGWAEAKFYRIVDFFRRTFYWAAGSDYTIQSIKENMGEEGGDRETIREYLARLGDGSIKDYTPPSVEVRKELDAMKEEGKWKPVLDKIFNLRDEKSPPSLYRTFVRTDPERPYAVANLAAWDPRMVELHVVAGAVEPKAATGRAGTGMIPRDDETMLRLLAGFNGGFQALHGEFGLMQEGKVYLPPKPWAATVAILKGGRIGFGTWPGPEAGQIPKQIVSYRQNLTPLIQDSQINPYKRRWWGSSPDLNPDSPMIARSGICWTKSNNIVYSLAYSVNEMTFAETMKRAGCHYLIQLDVNAGHSGFEFSKVTGKKMTPALDRELDEQWEAEGPVKDRDDLVFRTKKFFKKMALMRFPRYLGKEPRDFFYLTLKRILPGPAIAPGPGEIEDWRTDGIPGNSFPPSFAYATVHPAGRKAVKLVRVDPKSISIAAGSAAAGGMEGGRLTFPSWMKISVAGEPGWDIVEGEKAVIFGYDEPAGRWEVSIEPWKDDIKAAYGKVIAIRIPSDAENENVPAAGVLGIGPHHFFTWAESSDNDMETMKNVLERAGVTQVVKIPARAGDSTTGAGWSFTSAQDEEAKFMPLLAEKAFSPDQPFLTFAAAPQQEPVRLFPDTDIVPPKVWNPPQVKRIRYFRPEPTPDAGVAEDGE